MFVLKQPVFQPTKSDLFIQGSNGTLQSIKTFSFKLCDMYKRSCLKINLKNPNYSLNKLINDPRYGALVLIKFLKKSLNIFRTTSKPDRLFNINFVIYFIDETI